MMEWVMYLALGAAMGTLGGIFGIGGGLIAIPVLALFFNMDQQLAQGTALVMVVPNILLAMWRYHQRTPINVYQALPLAAGGVVFAGLASLIAVGLDPNAMRIGFAVFMLVLAGYNYAQMFLPKAQGDGQVRASWKALLALGGGSGVLGGFFGVGGSVLATPVLTSVFGASQVAAQALSLALAAPSTGITLVTYALHHHVNWLMGVPMAVGGLVSVSWGVKVAYRLPERTLRTLFCLFLVLCAALLGLKG